jgi:hypothetical protein
MNIRRSPSGPELPSVIGQFAPQTLAAGNFVDLTLSGIPRVFPGDPMVVTNGVGGSAGALPMLARSVNPGEIIVTMWNVSGIAQTWATPFVFKVILL